MASRQEKTNGQPETPVPVAAFDTGQVIEQADRVTAAAGDIARIAEDVSAGAE